MRNLQTTLFLFMCNLIFAQVFSVDYNSNVNQDQALYKLETILEDYFIEM